MCLPTPPSWLEVSSVSFKAAVSLLIFCLEDLSSDVSGMLKSPTMTVLMSIAPLMSTKIFVICLGAPISGAYLFIRVIFSCWIDPFSLT